MRITKDAIRYVEDELESLRTQVDELEEELALALEENESLKAQNLRLIADRTFTG